MNIQPTFGQNLKPDWKQNHREVFTPQFWAIYTPPRVGHGWKSDELLYQHFWNENNSPGMLRKTHREQQQKTYLRFLTAKGDLFINNSWVPIEHAWQKQCYSIENTVICHCFIWHLHFFFFLPDTAKLSWMACKNYINEKNPNVGTLHLFCDGFTHNYIPCVFMQQRGTFSHSLATRQANKRPIVKTELSIPNGLVEGWCE